MSDPAARSVRDELEQAAVRIAKVDTRSLALGTESGYGAGLDLNTVCGEVSDRTLDRSGPNDAEIAVPRPHRQPGDVVCGEETGTMDVELRPSEPIREPVARPVRNELGTEDVTIKPIRHLPIGDLDDAVIKADPSGSSMSSLLLVVVYRARAALVAGSRMKEPCSHIRFS
jgi:hypothetical protein